MPATDQIKSILRQSLTTFSTSFKIDQFKQHLPQLDLGPQINKYRSKIVIVISILIIILVASIVSSILNLTSLNRSATTYLPPTPAVTTPSPVPEYQSLALPLKEIVTNFNSHLPDPDPADFDDKISLEPLTQ